MLITSLENNKIKYINKLKQKKYRDKENKFIIETFNLIEEADKNDALLEVYITEGTIIPFKLKCPVYEVTEEVMNKIKEINTSKILGICRKKETSTLKGSKYLMLDGDQEPGNLATIIRSSLAFEVDTIILSNDCCDIYNEKVIRATEGTIFKANIIKKDLKEVIKTLKEKNINVYGTDVTNGIEVSKIEKDNYCVIMGSEGNGIKEEIKNLIEKNIYIKTKNVESLNVAIATSIILYELNK